MIKALEMNKPHVFNLNSPRGISDRTVAMDRGMSSPPMS